MRRLVVIVIASLATAGVAQPQAQAKVTLSVFVDVFHPPVSPEGFVDAVDVKGLNDSVVDLTNAFDNKDWNPKTGWPGSPERTLLAADPAQADLLLTVAARGTSTQELGSRTTMAVYRGVVTADTVPTVGVTRWVSIVLSVGTYRKEFLTWTTNKSAFSLGSWTADANLLAQYVLGWTMPVGAKRLELQKARGGPVSAAPRLRVGEGTDLPAPKRVVYVPPIYPPIAKAGGVTGSVVIEVTLDARGTVIDARVVQSVRMLDSAALAAVQQWRFAPTVINGVATPVIMNVIVAFGQ